MKRLYTLSTFKVAKHVLTMYTTVFSKIWTQIDRASGSQF